MKIVLAYSGGLDTSVIVKWLRETYDAEIVTFAADIGQEEELKGLPQKARRTGASKHYTLDLVEEFARDFVYPMIRAEAIYEGQYHLGTSIARPLIAKAQIDIARKENADTVAHGATGKGNDQCRFELTYMALAPGLQIIAPWKIEAFRETFPGRKEMIAYCRRHKIPVEASLKKPYSMDRNLLHISYEAGILEDPWFDPTTRANKAMFKLSVSPEDAPSRGEYVELDFAKGDCVAVNGQRLSPAGVLRALNKLGGRHGIGRVDLVENRFVGMKSRGVADDGPGGHAPARLAHPQVRRAGLQRLLVRARAGGPPGPGGREPALRHRHRPAQALQGQRHHLRAQVAVLALRHQGGVDGGGEELVQPERRHRLHPPERPPAARAQPGAARAQGLRALRTAR